MYTLAIRNKDIFHDSYEELNSFIEKNPQSLEANDVKLKCKYPSDIFILVHDLRNSLEQKYKLKE